jgi:general stress protein 26
VDGPFCDPPRIQKAQEIERSGRLTLAYQYDPDSAYVTLIGRAVINDDVAAKTANWRPESYRWYPGGPANPNVVYVDFTADRIELWSSRHGVEPDPIKGLWAAALIRKSDGWHQQTTLPQSAQPAAYAMER